ncbi:MAG TPA: ATP-binding cassette domain-containing protein, partial [Puia sp.]|nr:ATP-binding cassette domain-containing protein [Puia sp.]
FHPFREAAATTLDTAILARLRQEALENAGRPFRYAVRMTNTTIRYGDALILDKINWEVKKGECWNVSGPNGAGKSTLLSLITADNPQAYANEIWLFDRRRGSGESIWDIKKRIGFVSPELHLYFDTGATAFDVVASGLFDTIGLFRALNEEQETLVSLWMRLLSLWDLRSRRLVQLSTGQQRMVLLARALIKNPPMLILDEPCQGLDDEQTERFRALINTACNVFGTTLIYVSHYRQELPACIDHFLQLDRGAIVDG